MYARLRLPTLKCLPTGRIVASAYKHSHITHTHIRNYTFSFLLLLGVSFSFQSYLMDLKLYATFVNNILNNNDLYRAITTKMSTKFVYASF